MSTFGIYAIGLLIFIGGLAYGAVLLGVPAQWIAIGVAVIVGLGVLTGAAKTRQKDETE